MVEKVILLLLKFLSTLVLFVVVTIQKKCHQNWLTGKTFLRKKRGREIGDCSILESTIISTITGLGTPTDYTNLCYLVKYSNTLISIAYL